MRDAIASTTLVGIRLAGPGIYYPAHLTPQGKQINARFEGTFAVNKSYIDRATNTRVERVDYLRCIAWNGNSAVAGKGFADMLAKYCPPGKEIKYAKADVKTYDGRVFDANNNPLADATGAALLTKKVSFDLDHDDFILGEDSNKALAQEYAQFAANGGMMAFEARPAGWRTPGDPGSLQWTEILAWRGQQVCNPQLPTYGYAKMGRVNGTIVASHTAPAVGAVGAVVQPVAAVAPLVAAPVTVAAPLAAAPLVAAPLPAPVVAVAAVAPLATAAPVSAPMPY